MRAFDYVRASDLEDAIEALGQAEGTKLLAGGTSLLFFLRSGLVSVPRLVDISRLHELHGIAEEAGGSVRIGALVTHRELERSALVRRVFPFVAELERDVGTVQMRNRGTVGGNLCHADPAGDLAPAFLALGGEVDVAGHDGVRGVDLDNFFHDYYTTDIGSGEILTGVRVRPLAEHSAGAYVKYVSRMSNDFTLVGVAAVIALDDQGRCRQARIAVSGAAAHAFRGRDAEATLVSERLSGPLLARVGELAAAASSPVGDHRGSADYRRDMVGVMAARAVEMAWQRAAGPGLR